MLNSVAERALSCCIRRQVMRALHTRIAVVQVFRKAAWTCHAGPCTAAALVRLSLCSSQLAPESWHEQLRVQQDER